MTKKITATVNSPTKSKINAVQVLGAGLTLVTAFGLPLSVEQKAAVLTASGVVVPVVTGLLRSLFTAKKH